MSDKAQAASSNDPSALRPLCGGALKDLEKSGLGTARTVVIMCSDEDKAKCASAKNMHRVWKALKHGVKNLRRNDGISIAAVRSQCLGVCEDGPIVGVLPHGKWYGHCDEHAVASILAQVNCDAPQPALKASPSPDAFA